MTTQILDGKALAVQLREKYKAEAAQLGKKLRLAIVEVGEHPASAQFVEQKVHFAEAVGIAVRRYRLAADISAGALRKKLAEIVHARQNNGVIIQLPLPGHLNTQTALNSVVPQKDVDVLSSRSVGDFATGKSLVLPPMAGAVKLLLEEARTSAAGKVVAVIGAGRLVGKPVALWLLREGASVLVVRSSTPDISVFTQKADIVISGAGKPGLVTADMIKKGAVVIDAGTGESEGRIVGDVAQDVREVAGYLAPVPGGVGPLTVAMVFGNLLALAKRRHS